MPEDDDDDESATAPDIDQWDVTRAQALLAVIEPGTGASDGRKRHERERIDEITGRDLERIANVPPLDDDHPIWSIVGIVSSAEPTDMANHKDEYIADAIEHSWR